MNASPRSRWNSPLAHRWLVVAALILLAAAAVLLGYALLPGGEPLRLQSTLDPTRMILPGGLP